nr:uncharacterized protein LOC117280858 [Nicotiana tomentosiformis]
MTNIRNSPGSQVRPLPIPKRLKMSDIPKYDGTSDPRDHVTAFTTGVKGNDLTKQKIKLVLVKKFGETLTKGALTCTFGGKKNRKNDGIYQRERMMLPQVPDNWAALASNLNEKSSEATRRLKESLWEFTATTWNDVYNRYNTKLRIEEDMVTQPRVEERPRSRRSKMEKMTGKFLGFLVSNKGIEVNHAQIKAIEEIPDVLTSKKEQNQFEWNNECQQALKDLKSYLSKPPLLAKPRDEERLLIYLAVSEVSVSPVLVHEDKGKQPPIYYVNKSLLDAETWYPYLEELALALIMPRTAIKSQVLADFVADFSSNLIPEAEKELRVFTGANLRTWTLFTDGSSNVKGAGLGINLISPSEEVIRQAIKCYPITNNESEYEAVIAGLELTRELGIEQIIIKSDSQLVVNQMQGTYVERETRMEKNAEADALANLASVADALNAENTVVIKRITSAPYHLVANSQAESTNKVIINNLKKRLEESKGVVRSTIGGIMGLPNYDKDKHGRTPFLLVYGTETLIPVEIGEPSTRYMHTNEASNEEELCINLDLTEDRREATWTRMEAQK